MSAGLRLLFLLPFSPQAGVGNATTARRLCNGLKRFGHSSECMQVPADLRPAADGQWQFPADLQTAAKNADVIVALHAVKAAPAAVALAQSNGCKTVVLFTGTDLNGKPPAWALQAVKAAAASVALSPPTLKRAREKFQCTNVQMIVQAAAPLPEPRGGAAMPKHAPKLADEDFLIFLPSGLRPVKAPRRGIQALRKLAARRPEIRLWIAGMELDADEAAAVKADVAKFKWAEYVGALTQTEMAAVMRRANLVLSTSRSEGGAPNCLLEAALFAKPIAASNIAVHRFFPGQRRLFQEDSDLVRMVEHCLQEPQMEALEARQLREETRTRFDRTKEAVSWDRLLRKVANPPVTE